MKHRAKNRSNTRKIRNNNNVHTPACTHPTPPPPQDDDDGVNMLWCIAADRTCWGVGGSGDRWWWLWWWWHAVLCCVPANGAGWRGWKLGDWTKPFEQQVENNHCLLWRTGHGWARYLKPVQWPSRTSAVLVQNYAANRCCCSYSFQMTAVTSVEQMDVVVGTVCNYCCRCSLHHDSKWMLM